MNQDGAFLFKQYHYQRDTNSLYLYYAFEGGDSFEEVITFPPCKTSLSNHDELALDRAFRLIFLLAGVSYYKAYVPQTLKCEAFPLDEITASFLEKVYRQGLAEFAHHNKLDLDLHFVVEKTETLVPLSLNLPHRHLVPVGGGKDSILTIECLKKAKQDVTLFALGTHNGLADPIKNTISESGLPSLNIQRTISKNLLELNREGAFNGHVPITAILSSIAVACAILHRFDAIVLSNEHSASAPNIKIGTHEVNHQYSKSFAFEQDFSTYVQGIISPDINYFSFLRPLSETEITRRFSALSSYHAIFRSCNTAFRQDEKTRGKNWCCACPKCRFVFLALAPFLKKEKLTALFGQNLLSDQKQLEGFKELCGLSSHKPFECVGEIEESALLMGKLAQMEEWKHDPIVAAIGPSLYNEQEYEALFQSREGHLLSEKYLRILNENK